MQCREGVSTNRQKSTQVLQNLSEMVKLNSAIGRSLKGREL